jgi:hypothetical protein
MMKVNSFLVLVLLFMASLAAALTEEQLEGLDEATREYVISEQQRIEADAAAKVIEEQKTLKAKEIVFNWPLVKKIEVLQSGGPYTNSGVNEDLVREMLYAELAQNYSITWQGNVGGLADLRSKMESLRPYIFELSESPKSSDNSYAVKFGKYLQIDRAAESMFYEILNTKLNENQDGVREVLDVIFGYNLDTEELRNELVQGLALNKEIAEQSRFGKDAELDAGTWGLEEAATPLMLLVENSYSQTGKINRTAVKSLKELGASAAVVLPRLEKLLAQRLSDGNADFREIESLEYAISAIKRGVGNYDTSSVSSTSTVQNYEIEELVKEPAEVKPVEVSEETPEQSSQWWMWLVGTLVILGGGVLFIRSKNEHLR